MIYGPYDGALRRRGTPGRMWAGRTGGVKNGTRRSILTGADRGGCFSERSGDNPKAWGFVDYRGGVPPARRSAAEATRGSGRGRRGRTPGRPLLLAHRRATDQREDFIDPSQKSGPPGWPGGGGIRCPRLWPLWLGSRGRGGCRERKRGSWRGDPRTRRCEGGEAQRGAAGGLGRR